MKVAVLSVALLFCILLCPPAQAKALLEGTQDDLRELDLDNVVDLETPLPPLPGKLLDLRVKRLAASLDA